MSLVATRMPLDTIGMNRVVGSSATRRSARLSVDGDDERKPRNAAASSTSKAKEGKKRKQDYDQESDGFVFTKSKRAKSAREGTAEAVATTRAQEPVPKQRRHLPTTPERQSPARAARRQNVPPKSPHREAHAQSHANERKSASPVKPLTVEKRRRKPDNGRMSRIVLPTSDTPIIRRNKAMRESTAQRRSSSGTRGRRVSSMLDEGKWNALPHSAVTSSEFYTIISPDLTEPRRMRLLLGWCGDRALPPKAQAPSGASKQASEDFQAEQAARVIQEELCKELGSNGALSEWFSRDADEPPPKIVLRKKPNPRNIANAAKVLELERELERLKQERAAWTDVEASASWPATTGAGVSPLHRDLLPDRQRAIFDQLTQASEVAALDPAKLQQQLHNVSSRLEFAVDNLAHTIYAVRTTHDLAERIAQHSTRDAAQELERRQQDLTAASSGGRTPDALDALRGLARLLNS